MILPPEAPRIPQHLLDHATLLSDRMSMLPLLPRGAVFVEVGVGLGDFSQAILSVCEPASFLAIDRFDLHELPELWGQPTGLLFGGRSHGEAYRQRFAAEMGTGRLRVLAGDSHERLEGLQDGSVDVIYIDADHREEAVRRDLAAARPKLRDGGWIIVNDYLMVAALGDAIPYGVVNATNAFMIEHQWGARYFALQTRMFCDVALRQHRVLREAGPSAEALADECGRLRAEVQALRRSGCWRATAPLRALSRLTGRPLRRLLG